MQNNFFFSESELTNHENTKHMNATVSDVFHLCQKCGLKVLERECSNDSTSKCQLCDSAISVVETTDATHQTIHEKIEVKILLEGSQCFICFGFISILSYYLNFTSNFNVQSNLCTTTSLKTQNSWPLLTDGRCSEAGLCYTNLNWNSKILVAVSR